MRPEATSVEQGLGATDEPAGFVALIEELRGLQELLSATAPPAPLIADARDRIAAVSTALREHVVSEDDQLAGTLLDVPGRAQALVPVLHLDEETPDSRRGRVTFGRFYLGGGGAAHAGAIPLVFGEFLFWLGASGRTGRTRTAYLHVDYRSLTPLAEELSIAGWVERDEGRKRFVRGTLFAGDRVCAAAEALYLEARPDST